jgi:hypothetical protein
MPRLRPQIIGRLGQDDIFELLVSLTARQGLPFGSVSVPATLDDRKPIFRNYGTGALLNHRGQDSVGAFRSVTFS